MFDLAPETEAQPPAHDDQLLRKMRMWVNADYDGLRHFRKEAQAAFAAYSGGNEGQWLKEELEALDGVRQPLTINRVQALIDAAVGHEINSRSDITYKPRSIGRTAKNEILTQGVEHYRDEADAAQEETAAMKSMYVCGVGAVETTMDYDEDPQGRLLVQERDVMMCGWDHRARRPNLTDAARAWVAKEISVDEAMEMFPNAARGDLDAKWWRGHTRWEEPDYRLDTVEDEHENGLNEDKAGSGRDKLDTVIVLQVEWRQKERRVTVIDPRGGDDIEMTEAMFAVVSERFAMLTGGEQIPHRVRRKYVYYKTFVGRRVLEHDESPLQTGFSIKFMTGYRDQKKRHFYGLTRNLMGPQTWLNRMLTQLLHIINTNAKGGMMMEEDAVEDHREAEDNWAASDSILWTEPGAVSGGKIQTKPAPQIPAAINDLISLTDAMFYKVSGLSPELLGQAETQVAGVLEHQRRQSSMAVLASFFDARKLYLKQVGELMLELIQREYIPPEALIRIAGPEGEMAVPLAYAKASETRFDVMIDESPDSPNAKERNWAVVSQMLGIPGVQQMLTPELWGAILKTSPLPSTTVEAINQEIAKGKSEEAMAAQQAAEEEQKQIQERMLRLEEMEAEAAMIRAKADAAYKMAQARSVMAQIGGEVAKDQADAQKDQAYAAIAMQRAQFGADVEERRARRRMDARRDAAELALKHTDQTAKRRLDLMKMLQQRQERKAA